MKKKRILFLCFIIMTCVVMIVEWKRLYRAEYGTGFKKQIIYGDKEYQFDDSILTYLIMGIDKGREKYEAKYPEEIGQTMSDGQADAVFLCVLRKKTQEIDIVTLNRNTMTDIAFYNEDGIFLVTEQAQLAIQHGFGTNEKESCELQMRAVQNLMYGIPIQGYVSVDMTVIEQLNQAVDGVDVKVLENMEQVDPEFVEGNIVHLQDEQAFWYVKYRDTQSYASADRRLERQKQFLADFAEKAICKTREDVLFPYQLYMNCKGHMYTNLSADKLMYLVRKARQYEINTDHFYSLPGETRMGREYEEFYVDEDKLTEMMIELFYEEKEK